MISFRNCRIRKFPVQINGQDRSSELFASPEIAQPLTKSTISNATIYCIGLNDFFPFTEVKIDK